IVGNIVVSYKYYIWNNTVAWFSPTVIGIYFYFQIICCRKLSKEGSYYIRFLKHSRKCRSEEHTFELQSRFDIVCRLLLAKKTMVGLQTTLTASGFLITRRAPYSHRYYNLVQDRRFPASQTNMHSINADTRIM